MADAPFDIVIRGGTVVDGLGGTPYDADVAIRDGKIAEIGRIVGSGREELDARGKIVTPGFVDIHTHYDAQATWDNRLAPSSQHGITTAVMGNCGVGFAPCGEQHRAMLLDLMEGVEEIPTATMEQGLPWEWETFPQFLDFLGGRSYDMDIAAYIPHSAVRIYAMGERGMKREPATGADLARMAEIVGEAVTAGALGFSTSRMSHHRTPSGELAPTITAGEEELRAIGQAMKQAGRGLWQLNNDFYDTSDTHSTEFEMLRRLVAGSGRPMSFTLNQKPGRDHAWRTLLDLLDEANGAGLDIKGQVFPRAVGSLFGLALTLHPFKLKPSFQSLKGRPHGEVLAAMRDPALRARLLAEPSVFGNAHDKQMAGAFAKMFSLGNPPVYEPAQSETIGARAAAAGVDPLDLAYDLLLENQGTNLLYLPGTNYAFGNFDAALDMMLHDNTILGLGDGGAHYGSICDASYPTFLLTYWTRERSRGGRVDLPWAIKALTSDISRFLRFDDRGAIRQGLRADINVIDYDNLRLYPPVPQHDLPGGSTRMMQPVDGFDATLVNGHITYRQGQATSALPGRLIRA